MIQKIKDFFSRALEALEAVVNCFMVIAEILVDIFSSLGK